MIGLMVEKRESDLKIIMDKIDIYNFLNKRYSIRNLSDEQFDSIVSELALQLESVNFIPKYDEVKLKTDWKKLCDWKNLQDDFINSTSRVGMKLCEHFFPNFYDIKNNKNVSFSNSWKKENLEKILKWNRKSHSTPYLSELKRGIYFCLGLTKNTMFRPQIAKLICMRYNPKIVFDPCAGWGGRMLGVVSSGANYIAFEPNNKTYNNLLNLAEFLGIQDKVRIICDDALNMDEYSIPKVDMILTSPPYFDLEIYCDERTQSITNRNSYQEWNDSFLQPLIDKSLNYLNKNGYSCWNVGKVNKNNMFDDVFSAHKNRNFNRVAQFSVTSSKRPQSHRNIKINKSSDVTEIYKHEPI